MEGKYWFVLLPWMALGIDLILVWTKEFEYLFLELIILSVSRRRN
jgi:hypothetical protein